MRRRPLRDVVLLSVLVPLWLGALGLHVYRSLTTGLAWLPIEVRPAESPDAHPGVAALWSGADPAAVGVSAGDHLLSLGGEDLRGAGRLAVFTTAYAHAGRDPIPARVLRAGAEVDTALALQPIPFAWRTTLIAIGFGLSGIVALWRGRGSRSALAWALAAFAYSLHWSVFFGGPPRLTELSLLLFTVCGGIVPALTVRAALLLPETAAPQSRAIFWWPWALVVNGVGLASWILGVPFDSDTGLRIVFAVNILMLTGTLAALTRNYLAADALGRRQIKWVVLGFYLGVAPVVATAAFAWLDPALRVAYEYSLLATLFIPLCVYIAILRYQFLDIDRLLSATAVYSILLIAFQAGMLNGVPLISDFVTERSDLSRASVQGLVSIALAAVLVPLGRGLNPWVERLLFRERTALERGARRVRAELAACPAPEALLRTFGERLVELLRLDGCAIFAPSGAVLVPVFVRGAAVPPAIDASGALVELLEEASAPVAQSQWRRWTRRRRVSGQVRAALEALGAQVLLPVQRGRELLAFAALGEKRSGDIFTRTDLALLEGLTDRVSAELLRFDGESVEREEKQMYQRLQGYVPSVVAKELARGADLADGERDVSILFVDIRGYTSFSESRSAGQVFEVVNRYTEAVSRVISEAGGSVIEFHGDGLLAVFGAPHEIDGKEGAAVAAAREIVRVVERLEVKDPDGTEIRLGCGVGIATGPTFVGNVQSVDRRIWTVIGNTTNLAARLQALSRDLKATIVIDETTGARCAGAIQDFTPLRGVRVKGRSDALLVYAKRKLRMLAAA
jgi:class 3 adenylate cyclase